MAAHHPTRKGRSSSSSANTNRVLSNDIALRRDELIFSTVSKGKMPTYTASDVTFDVLVILPELPPLLQRLVTKACSSLTISYQANHYGPEDESCADKPQEMHRECATWRDELFLSQQLSRTRFW